MHDHASGPLRGTTPAAGRGIFINLGISEACRHGDGCRTCLEVCPVDVFSAPEGGDPAGREGSGRRRVGVRGENEDECILCDLCLKRCPEAAITLTKLYHTA